VQHYDIIGDIHGQATKLENLLETLSYKLINNVYQHASRKVIFVGDFIDAGPEETKTLTIVKNMVEANSALAIMGNHEFNAICYATPNSDKPNTYLREHSSKNFGQHQAFLTEYPFGSQKHTDIINWFKSLPVYLDLEQIRVIHACWHEDSLAIINKSLNENKTIPDHMFITASDKSHEHYDAIENVMKGLEQQLPHGVTFKDKYNILALKFD